MAVNAVGSQTLTGVHGCSYPFLKNVVLYRDKIDKHVYLLTGFLMTGGYLLTNSNLILWK